ncbi:aldehyde-activating protein [Thiospirochaeta perfilievii]|uniref:Aldehyde-activating protein n=1 Tax=Thiospirochaeta perfilievii TaxID=252967 RepID=A0A5C1QAV7_9SPIO|nr:GFA family protein [Thiospirochaeta perfilievii]QEN04617.1 aldehyde-activating protein [Thiospirochaeta perfilievii]
MGYNGSCLCGEVKFIVIGGISSFYLCHCEYCRKDSGSAHASNLFFNHGIIEWKKGKNKIINYNFNGTKHNKSFCSICGSALPIENKDYIVVPAGSLDCDIDKLPDGHIFMESKGNWDNKLETIKKFDKLPV